MTQLKRRNTLKDGIIMIQTLLIIIFIIVPIFLLLDKDDHKAGMEEDHTYEVRWSPPAPPEARGVVSSIVC